MDLPHSVNELAFYLFRWGTEAVSFLLLCHPLSCFSLNGDLLVLRSSLDELDRLKDLITNITSNRVGRECGENEDLNQLEHLLHEVLLELSQRLSLLLREHFEGLVEHA